MEKVINTILENIEIAESVYRMTLECDDHGFARSGQFAMIEVPGKYLRRPISVSSYDSDRYTLVYKVVGEGTLAMSEMEAGVSIDALTGLGNGFDTNAVPDGAMVIGGGIGVPPMLGLVKQLIMAGKKARVVLGFNTLEDVIMEDDFRDLSEDVTIMTADGSYGKKGMVTDATDHEDYICACGPVKMLKALEESCEGGQFSLESRMGCGFGACMGCSIRTKSGNARVCKDGPVFDKEAVVWAGL